MLPFTNKLPLLVLSCSQDKQETATPLPFIDVYCGPIWQQVRKSGYPETSIAAISALYGFLPPGQLIRSYDMKMDDERAHAISHTSNHIWHLAKTIEAAGSAYIVGGKHYQQIARTAEREYPALQGRISFATGSYLQQRKQLNHFLTTHTSRTLL